MKSLVLATSVITFVGSILLTSHLSKKVGRKEAINTLREEQLDQAAEEFNAKLKAPYKGNLDEYKNVVSSLEKWYANECTEINSMYDEIVNNVC